MTRHIVPAIQGFDRPKPIFDRTLSVDQALFQALGWVVEWVTAQSSEISYNGEAERSTHLDGRAEDSHDHIQV